MVLIGMAKARGIHISQCALKNPLASFESSSEEVEVFRDAMVKLGGEQRQCRQGRPHVLHVVLLGSRKESAFNHDDHDDLMRCAQCHAGIRLINTRGICLCTPCLHAALCMRKQV